MKKTFDAHKLFTTEINGPYTDLLNYIQSKESNTYTRHSNLQLATYDWHHDLIVSMERSREEMIRSLGHAKAIDILNWAAYIRKEIQSRGPSYWEASDRFFEIVITSSLKNNLQASDFESVYQSEVGKWVSYVTKLTETKNGLEHEIDILQKRKHLLQSEMTSTETQVDKLKAYLKDLGDLKNAYDRKMSLENQIKEVETDKAKVKKELDKLVGKSRLANLAVQARSRLDGLLGSPSN